MTAESKTPDTLASSPVFVETSPSERAPSPSANSPAPSSECRTMGAQEGFESGIDTIPSWNNHEWVLSDFSQFRPCDELTWLTITIADGTVSSPYHIMLFHKGHYVGTATQEPQDFYPSITRNSSSEIGVTYHWPREGETITNPTGTTDAAFRWDEEQEKVVMEGDIPQR